jgi:hypothetical protein
VLQTPSLSLGLGRYGIIIIDAFDAINPNLEDVLVSLRDELHL